MNITPSEIHAAICRMENPSLEDRRMAGMEILLAIRESRGLGLRDSCEEGVSLGFFHRRLNSNGQVIGYELTIPTDNL
jgi:hypothetical protein